MDDADFIKFNCNHCRGRIRVHKDHAGKKGKCPRCNQAITIPYESASIELKCKSCGLSISVPRLHAGKEGFCPKCKSPILIQRANGDFTEEQSDTEEPNTRLVGSAGNLTLLDVPEESKLKDESTDLPIETAKTTAPEPETIDEPEIEKVEPSGQRKLPWLIDILLYPVSMSGLIHLGIFTVIPTLIALATALMGLYGMFLSFLGFLINLAIGLYMYWYFSECVRDSANGGTRAPVAFAIVDLGEMFFQMLYIIICCIVFFAPAGVYYAVVQEKGVIFWLLLFYGIFFFPMGLLAIIMFDSLSSLNPLLLIGSIVGTFFEYCGIVLLFTAILVALRTITTLHLEAGHFSGITIEIFEGGLSLITLYIIFILAHLIGRFYWRNEEKLNWEV